MAQEFMPSTRPPQVGYALAGVMPPSALYVGPDDTLLLESWGSVAGAFISVRGRVLTPQGLVQNLLFGHTPTTNRTRGTTDERLTEGFLLGLLLEETGTGARRGQVYVQASLMRGLGAVSVKQQQLISGYLATGSDLSWPISRPQGMVEGPGVIRSITGTDPAAGAEISETVPTNARWRLLTFAATLNTNATAGNRLPNVIIDDGTTVLGRWRGGTNIPASSVTPVVFSGSTAPGTGAVVSEVRMPPMNLLLLQGFRIRTVTEGLLAGDNYGAPQLWVEEWIEE